MRKVTIEYFPAVGKANLWMDGRLADPKTNPAAGRLRRDRAEQWLYPLRSGYQAWRGLLPELMDASDDDELVITVQGPEDFWEQLRAAFQTQEDAAEGLGYRRDGYTLQWKRERELDACKAFLARIYRDCGTFLDVTDQMDAMLQAAYEETFAAAASYEHLCRASCLLVQLLERQAEGRPACAEVFGEWIGEIRTELWGEL